jgi:hypothetical protein
MAMDQNIHLRSSWFRYRSACYLAAGKSVIVQDTEFSEFLPTSEGILIFSIKDAALEIMSALLENYQHHAAAATRLAREFFDSDHVLRAFLQTVFACND